MPANDLTQVIIFGASGDLTARKLVPALFAAHCEQFFPGRFQLVGVARRPWDDAAFRQTLDQTVPKDKNHHAEKWQQFLGLTSYVQTHLETPADYAALGKRLDAIAGGPAHRVFYLAVKPDLCLPSVQNLRDAGMLDQSQGLKRRLVVDALHVAFAVGDAGASEEARRAATRSAAGLRFCVFQSARRNRDRSGREFRARRLSRDQQLFIASHGSGRAFADSGS